MNNNIIIAPKDKHLRILDLYCIAYDIDIPNDGDSTSYQDIILKIIEAQSDDIINILEEQVNK